MAGSQTLFDELLAGAIEILRLAAGERKKIIARLAKLEKELIKKLGQSDLSKPSKRLFNSVVKSANVSIAKAYSELAEQLNFPAIARYSSSRTIEAFEIALGIESLKLPKQDYYLSLADDAIILGHPSKDWWRGQDADTQFKFAGEVRQGLLAAETNQQIIARIVGNSSSVGIMETAKRNAAALVQTSVQSVANDARRATFEANDDVVKGLRQVSTLDSHTSKVCVAYSGAEWNLKREPINGNKLPYLNGCPRHFNCRSIDVPITKTFKELGLDVPEPKPTTRASELGPIAADITFDGFLKRRGKSYQDEILGPGRADLWRQGKITLRDLVNGQGREVSLSDLEALVRKRATR